MSLQRRIREHRATVILVVVVVLSLVSLASGKKGSLISGGIRTVVSVVAHPFWKALKFAENGYDYTTGFVMSYHASRAEADRLRGELEELSRRIADHEEVLAENRRLREMLRFQRGETRLTLQPASADYRAEVISRSEQTLTIDLGTTHGVERAMCVLTPVGLVGVVSEVGPFNAYVLTLHNADCRLGAMIERTRVRGVVKGSGGRLSHVCQMEYIDLKEDVRVGDSVVTTGSGVYPGGYPIGKVVEIRGGEGSLLKTAFIEPAADLYSVDEVFLVRRAQMTNEDLTGQAPEPAWESRAGDMPDDRTIQERYAP